MAKKSGTSAKTTAAKPAPTPEKKERVRRPKEELKVEYQQKIDSLRKGIQSLETKLATIQADTARKIETKRQIITRLETKLERLDNPTRRGGGRKKGVNALVKEAKAKGFTAEQIAEAFGLSLYRDGESAAEADTEADPCETGLMGSAE